MFLDAEHFFDGYRHNPEFALRVLRAAHEAGATRLVLCDTNGGTLPHVVEQTVAAVRAAMPDAGLGAHFHNDTDCAVANALAAVRQGAVQVQGCMNGYGERTGNANLTSIIPNLTLKMGIETVPRDRLELLTPVSHHIAELVNLTLDPQSPYVGISAFAHKAGLHTSAISRAPDAYEHIKPDAIGNLTRFVISEMAGRSTVAMRAKELGLDLSNDDVTDVLEQLKTLEHAGYHFEVADASFELLLRTSSGWKQDFFALESFRVIVEKQADGDVITEATIKLQTRGERHHRHRRGQRPGQRPRPGPAEGDRPGPSGAGRHPPHRLQGPGARHPQGDGRRHPGAARLGRRGTVLEHHRRLGEHHRGVVGRPVGLDRPRPAGRRVVRPSEPSGEYAAGR